MRVNLDGWRYTSRKDREAVVLRITVDGGMEDLAIHIECNSEPLGAFRWFGSDDIAWANLELLDLAAVFQSLSQCASYRRQTLENLPPGASLGLSLSACKWTFRFWAKRYKFQKREYSCLAVNVWDNASDAEALEIELDRDSSRRRARLASVELKDLSDQLFDEWCEADKLAADSEGLRQSTPDGVV